MVWLIILLAVLVFILYVLIENRLMLTVRHENLGGNVRVAQISDLHKRNFGKDNKRLAEKVKGEEPDVILITGDLVSRHMEDFSGAESLLHELQGTAPIYVIMGNHEKDLNDKSFSEYASILEENGAELLRNSSADIDVKGRKMKLYGLDESVTVYKKNDSYKNLDVLDTSNVEELLGECPEGEVLLMAHNPFFGEVYADWGAKYTFSGHVHGGVVRFFGKAVLSPERKLFPKNAKGVYTYGEGKLLVSAGLGKLRLFDPPEIVIYDI